ncbi:hypothetical protein [Mangrovihabitans endophyticus]|uniref:Uncharacterized protein n=1 Tax=Mangrovihabitans endophyticus TaxID=1751298 RepID=A0A8J3FQB5_9ACTN|nr:hypothetical protein [Mangrovihabitans endophyticus]GGL02010.1 hypothetical protein GCM10012284_40700 [Mangrovihabitans endophyticus]
MEKAMIRRPWLLSAVPCAPSVSMLPVSTPSVSLQESATPVAVLAAERAPVSRVDQVQIQAELVLTGAYRSNGTTGFVGSNGLIHKRTTDGASGVPPRGRPV